MSTGAVGNTGISRPVGAGNVQRPTSNLQHPKKRAAPPSRLVRGDEMLDVGRSMLDVRSFSSAESDGCLVALAVFKTVVGSFNGSRYVRFVPSPPPRFTICDLRFAGTARPGLTRPPPPGIGL